MMKAMLVLGSVFLAFNAAAEGGVGRDEKFTKTLTCGTVKGEKYFSIALSNRGNAVLDVREAALNDLGRPTGGFKTVSVWLKKIGPDLYFGRKQIGEEYVIEMPASRASATVHKLVGMTYDRLADCLPEPQRSLNGPIHGG